ncbi:probable cyclic nucleotide-gated ion channel 20, chloroplastic isoform X2 [Punica granatum]|uniref:Probable cyclic nucleotide-gated ion channel 20, chloroplastic isoform X2 n=1 Tax=Punica granatum TaxID=22663 RepID=A0A6P8ECT3_PUNGR|nr:probable cyclic nucleotide-gated ion channel 20, chloroplastic isoform X2 [Punica granatum]
MADSERDVIPMLSAAQEQNSGGYEDPRFRALPPRTWRASVSIPSGSTESSPNQTHLVGYTGPLRSIRKATFSTLSGPIYGSPRPEYFFRPNQGGEGRNEVECAICKYPSFSMKDQNVWPKDRNAGKNKHLRRSGQLGMCNDPYCTTCPTYYHLNETKDKTSRSSGRIDPSYNAPFKDAEGWAKRFSSYITSCMPGVMNPHAKVIQRWNKFFVISCLVAVFVDPLFFFLPWVELDNSCIVLNETVTTTIVVFRSVTDFMYFLHLLLQFRLAYIAPESRVVGAGDLVDDPKKIALNYLKGDFFIDLLVTMPIPQVMILSVLPKFKGSSAANFPKNLLCAAILVQYIPRLYRFLPMLAGQSSTGFIFESAWANFVMNILSFMLSGHIVGSCWYLLGLQRVNQCLRDAYMDCGHRDKIDRFNTNTTDNTNATNCFSEDPSRYGIYLRAVNLTTEHSIVTRYVYSLFWGFQQISTLAGNQSPSYFVGEVLFTMAITGLGLLLFALLIGNIQNFLQAPGRRMLEMSLRRHGVELWMRHRRLPEELRRRVRQAERYNWAATQGINEEMVLENLSEDLQRDIRRHLFKFMKRVRIFELLDGPILDMIGEKLRQKTYIKGSKILSRDGLVDKTIFIVRGKLQSEGEDGVTDLCEGDVCGEELLAWCLGNSSLNKDGKRIRVFGQRLQSNRTVKCLTNVEVFTLRAADIEEVTRLFARFFRNPRVQGAIRYVSPYWRSFAATGIQVAWRYRKKRLTRENSSQSALSPK